MGILTKREIKVEATADEQQAAHLVAHLYESGHLRLGNFLMFLGCLIAEKTQLKPDRNVEFKVSKLVIGVGEKAIEWAQNRAILANVGDSIKLDVK